MKIKKFRIKNYKSIKDSGWCYLSSDITILAGKNESGKTGIIEALKDFDVSIENIPDVAQPLDNDHNPTIEVCFKPEKKIIEEITKTLQITKDITDYILQKDIIIIKSHEGTFQLEKQLNDIIDKPIYENNKKYITEFKNILPKINSLVKPIPEPNIVDDNIAEIKEGISQFISQLKALPKTPETKEEIISYEEQLTIINNNLSETGLSQKFLEEIKHNIPKFIFFSDFTDILKYEYTLTEAPDASVVNDFCKIAQLDLNRLINTDDSQRRKNILSRHSARITGDFQDFWKQNTLEIITEIDGDKLNFCIKEDSNTTKFKPEQRSKGFQWFLSFYLRLKAEKSDKNIILIDEPGLYLHAKAQTDVLRVLETISEESQIIFSTHSPYLIDPNRLDRVRLVLKDNQDGTKINNKIHAQADKETLTPILTTIGLSLNEGITNINQINNIVVEGMSDIHYLNAFKKIFDNQEINFIFGGGAGKMPFVGTILQGWGCRVLYLFDNDKGKRDGQKNLKDNWYIPESLILSVIDKEGKVIEDIFSKNDFKKHVIRNEEKEYQESNSQYLKARKKDKVLLAKQFLESSENIKINNLEKNTKDKITGLFKDIENKFDKINNKVKVQKMEKTEK